MIAVTESRRCYLSELRPFPGNAKTHDHDAIKESLSLHGQFRALVVNLQTMEVLAGNGTYAAMLDLGWEECLADFVDVDQEEAVRINLADNRIGELAPMDNGLLLALLEQIPTLEGTGYDQSFLDELRALVEGAAAPAGEDDVPERALGVEVITRPGDVWVLGKHRLLCADINDLLLPIVPALILTDPPYGMDLDADYAKTMGKGGDKILAVKSKTNEPVTGDDEPYDPRPLLERYAGVAEVFLFGFDYYAHRLPEVRDGGSLYVWDKRLDDSADKGYGSTFELIWSKAKHKRDTIRVKYFGVFGMDTEQRLHPTQKPVELMRYFIENFSRPGDKVLDCYAGSGATVIACQDTMRVCWAVEIEPAYCDVIAHRFQARYGILPVREADGVAVDFTARVAVDD